MDPKMDSGMVSKYYSLDEAIENGAAPIPISSNKTIDVQCTIDIMDHLLACEVFSALFFMMSYPSNIEIAVHDSSLCLIHVNHTSLLFFFLLVVT